MPGRAIPWGFPGGGISLVAFTWMIAGSLYIVKSLVGGVYIYIIIIIYYSFPFFFLSFYSKETSKKDKDICSSRAVEVF